VYVVVACSRCKLARTARADQRTAGCPRCGRRIVLKGARVFLETDDIEAAVNALAAVNESLAAGPLHDDGAWGDLQADGRPLPAGKRVIARRDLLSIARSLSAEISSFTAGELAEKADIPIERVAAVLERWSAEGVVYSPTHGTYVLVDP